MSHQQCVYMGQYNNSCEICDLNSSLPLLLQIMIQKKTNLKFQDIKKKANGYSWKCCSYKYGLFPFPAQILSLVGWGPFWYFFKTSWYLKMSFISGVLSWIWTCFVINIIAYCCMHLTSIITIPQYMKTSTLNSDIVKILIIFDSSVNEKNVWWFWDQQNILDVMVVNF